MSTVNSTNEVPGDVTNAVSVNTKFTNVNTASGAINEENVRSEGVDRRNLAGASDVPLAAVEYTTNSISTVPAGTVYAAQTGVNFFPITHGDGLLIDMNAAPVTIKDGDLVRIHFNIFLNSIDDAQYGTYGPAGPTSAGRAENPPDAIGMLFFPMWKINGGGAFTVLPNEADFNSVIVAPAGIRINNTTDKSDSVAFVSMEGYVDAGNCVAARNVHGSWNYIHTGADVTVEEIQLHGRGPMVYQYDGVSREFHAPVWGAGRYAANFLDIPAAGANFDVTLSNGQVGFMVLRGDS